MLPGTIRLVYHFYINDNTLQSELTKLHFACLKQYSLLFSDVLFVISLDDITRYDLISAVESKLCSLQFRGNLRFKIIKNDPYMREVDTFKSEIFDKLNDLDGITFFAHNKGTTNNYDDNLMYWIVAMYYFNLNYIEDVLKNLISYNSCIFYGPNPVADTSENKGNQAWNNTYSWVYPGTFYWINTKRAYVQMKNNNIDVLFDNRFAAENFPGNLCKLEKWTAGYPTDFYGINFCDWYHSTKAYIKSMVNETELEKFDNFYNKIIESLNE